MPKNKTPAYAIILAIFSAPMMCFNVGVFQFDRTHPGVQFPLDLRTVATGFFGIVFVVSQWLFWSHLRGDNSKESLNTIQGSRIEKTGEDTNARVRGIESKEN